MPQVEGKRVGFGSQGRERVGRAASWPHHVGCHAGAWTGLSAGWWHVERGQSVPSGKKDEPSCSNHLAPCTSDVSLPSALVLPGRF